MVHMRMRHDDVANLLTLLAGGSQREAAGVNGNALVNQKAGQTLFGGCVTLTIKGAG